MHGGQEAFMLEKVAKILSEFTDVPAEEIKAESRLSGDLGLTSLELVGVLGRLEEEFQISIDDIPENDFQTVQDILTALSAMTGN